MKKQTIRLSLILGLTIFSMAGQQGFSSLILDFTTGSSTLGNLVDGFSASDIGTSVTVPGSSSLQLTFQGISFSPGSTGATGASLNGTGSNFGIDLAGATSGDGDDSDRFDADFDEFFTFSFNQEVEVSEIDMASLTGTDSFQFHTQTINSADASGSVFTFSTPLSIAANTNITVGALSGNVGLDAITLTVVPEPTAIFFLSFVLISAILIRLRPKKRSSRREYEDSQVLE